MLLILLGTYFSSSENTFLFIYFEKVPIKYIGTYNVTSNECIAGREWIDNGNKCSSKYI